jgi:hypothetical protein
MNRSLMTMLMGVVVASCLASAPASAREIRIFPPAPFIATATPVYYEGHAAYWYRDSWHYRDGRNWRIYREEPRFLREYRTRREPERHFYRHRRR